MLELAARLAWRGRGGAEPNPLVGCVIERDGAIAGWGLHRRCGEGHAERLALASAGDAARGATAYVTLQPCNGAGRTGACTVALIEAGVRRVVFAVEDPHPKAVGGIERLRDAGIAVERVPCRAAEFVSAPFIHRVRTGLPWVTAKWAQSLDGRIATGTGESRWISGARSRLVVHRERGRVDAIITGIGTVLADDPLLTARGVRRRRVAHRVVADPMLEIPLGSKLVRSAREAPLTIVAREDLLQAEPERARALRDTGAEVWGVPLVAGAASGVELALAPLLKRLAEAHGVATVMLEAGARLLGAFFRQGLVQEALVFLAPIVIGAHGRPAIEGIEPGRLADAMRLHLVDQRRRGEDVMLVYRAPFALPPVTAMP